VRVSSDADRMTGCQDDMAAVAPRGYRGGAVHGGRRPPRARVWCEGGHWRQRCFRVAMTVRGRSWGARP